jgi:hypothetical protein
VTRKPTSGELAVLGRLLAAAGSKTKLQQWVKQLPSQKAGRPASPDNEAVLIFLELYLRLHVRTKRNTALKTFVHQMQAPRGKTREAVVRRYAAKLRDPEFIAGLTEEKLRAYAKEFFQIAALKRVLERRQKWDAEAMSQSDPEAAE